MNQMKLIILGVALLSNVVSSLPADFCRERPTFNSHPDDCSSFVICLAGKSIVQMCTFPFKYGSETICYGAYYGTCDQDNAAPKPTFTATTTTTTPATTTTTTTTTTTKTPNSVHHPGHNIQAYTDYCRRHPTYNAHPYDCTKYISCVKGYPIIKTCLFHLQYDSFLQRCSANPVIKCGSGSSTKQAIPQPVTKQSTKTPYTTIKKYSPSKPTTTKIPYTEASRQKYKSASQCDPANCKLPACWCPGKNTPNNMPAKNIPKMILLTMDDNVNAENYNLYSELFDWLTNPNGCPLKTTYFVSGDYNDFALTRKLYDKGHEIAVHTLSHKTPTTFWSKATYEQLVDEIVGMKRKLESYGIRDIVGYRNPFLQTAGDSTFSVLKDHGFLYDSTLPTRRGEVWWPYTLDYNTAPDHCVIEPCPTKSYPGLWEVPLLVQGDGVATCSMFDGCHRYPNTEDGVYNFFKENFDRHFSESNAPFPMFGHAAWMTHAAYKYRKIGITRFIKELNERDDVYFVSVSQAIEWMKNPTPLNRILMNTGPFSCY